MYEGELCTYASVWMRPGTLTGIVLMNIKNMCECNIMHMQENRILN